MEKYKSEYRHISKLKPWDKNPRGISEEGLKRLKRQIKKLGQYKPLIITPDGIVLGGNMRLKAYRELKIKEIWVSVVKPKSQKEKIEYALSDNDRVGFYEEDLLENLLTESDIKLEDFSVDLKEPINLKDLLNQEVEIDEKEFDENIETENVCPKCGYEW